MLHPSIEVGDDLMAGREMHALWGHHFQCVPRHDRMDIGTVTDKFPRELEGLHRRYAASDPQDDLFAFEGIALGREKPF